jgi:hypothetical protein
VVVGSPLITKCLINYTSSTIDFTFSKTCTSRGWSPASSTRHGGHWLAYCTCPGWLWWRIKHNRSLKVAVRGPVLWLTPHTHTHDGELGGMKIGRGNRSTRRKPAPAPLCLPQIPLQQTRDRSRAAAVRSQRLTAWAMARPFLIS